MLPAPGAQPTREMKSGTAVWFSARETVELCTQPERAPSDHEVYVEATCSLISSGTEMLVYRGWRAPDEPLGVETCEGSFGFPVKYGYQVIGEVRQAGRETQHLLGCRVFARHPHQDAFTLRAGPNLVVALPDEVTDEQAAFANLYDVALNALMDAPVNRGDVVVVLGLGILGLIITAELVRMGAHVIGVDPIGHRRTVARELGAAGVAPPEARDAVDEASGGNGADIAFEASGAAAGLQTAFEVTGADGTICVVAYYGTKDLTVRPGRHFHFRSQRVVSSSVVNVNAALSRRWTRARRFNEALRRTSSIDVDLFISDRFPLREASAAYRLVAEPNPETMGVLLEYRGRH